MDPTECILNIKDQIASYERGEATAISCPYCGKLNHPQVPFCCDLFGKASIAALGRLRFEEAKATAEQAMEKHQKN